MVPEARLPRLHIKLASFLAVLLVAASALGAEGAGSPGGRSPGPSGAFGLDAPGLSALLSRGELDGALAMGEAQLADTGTFGPAAYLYLARWIESREARLGATPESRERARLLYGKAYEGCAGLPRREAGLALIAALAKDELWDELLAFSSRFAAESGAEWGSERPRLDAFDALGLNAEAEALVCGLKERYASRASGEAEALSYYQAVADLRKGGAAWKPAFRRAALEGPWDRWAARIFTLAGTPASEGAASAPDASAAFTADELHALAMRDAVGRRDYGGALLEATAAGGAALSPTASKAMIADAGKAFLYSNSAAEGRRRFDELAADPSLPGGAKWTVLFYRARFARALEDWQPAVELFLEAARGAPTATDADSCRWYSADCAYKGALAEAARAAGPEDRGAAARRSLLDGLVALSSSWNDPATFSDLAGGLLRDSLAARDWEIVEAMAARLGPALAPDLAPRVAYAAARVAELGLSGIPAEGLSARFAAIAADKKAPAYYRALADWRRGAEPAALPTPPAAAEGNAAQAAAPSEAEALVAGFARFGLPDLALAEARRRSQALGAAGLERTAALLSSVGRPDSAMRLEIDLSFRPGFKAGAEELGLLYPRPYLDELRAAIGGKRPSEALALGLVRSESMFRADARSKSGAVGLSQLMAPTAAEQARALGLADYDLEAPADNLRIGLAYFSTLFERNEGRALRAMMAYNAGPGRLKSWLSAWGELPDDLLVETIGVEETRQYCRNILLATAVYGKLYYGKSALETIGELVGPSLSGGHLE
jgi:soluble lytic murein transglycosylase-like protein